MGLIINELLVASKKPSKKMTHIGEAMISKTGTRSTRNRDCNQWKPWFSLGKKGMPWFQWRGFSDENGWMLDALGKWHWYIYSYIIYIYNIHIHLWSFPEKKTNSMSTPDCDSPVGCLIGLCLPGSSTILVAEYHYLRATPIIDQTISIRVYESRVDMRPPESHILRGK